MKVQVYRNIHKSRAAGGVVYSIRDCKTRRVVGHASDVVLADVVFKVNESGRQRVLAQKRKNVHAWVEGTIVDSATMSPATNGVQVMYNPYKCSTFIDRQTGVPVHTADFVHLTDTVVAY